jgi:hypothetical protein
MLGVGPSNCVYGSTAMPLEVFRYDPAANRSEHLGAMPGGEVYSMLEREGKLYLCYYGGAVMNLYNPAKPFWKFGTGADANPVSFGGVGDGHLRPRAMVRGPNGLIYIGSEPPYGELGGAIGVWDPRQNRTIENYRHVITNQSIVSLAWEPKSGLLFGGSGNYGGGGTRAVEKEARFFAFDPKKREKVFEAALSPGARNYPATFAANGWVFTTVGDQLFVLDPQTMQTTKTVALPGAQVEISLGQLREDQLVGLTTKGVYVYDLKRGEIVHTAPAPVPVGSAGDSPTPVGDPPTGTSETRSREAPPPLVRSILAIPPGESPDGTGQWPVLPQTSRLCRSACCRISDRRSLGQRPGSDASASGLARGVRTRRNSAGVPE